LKKSKSKIEKPKEKLSVFKLDKMRIMFQELNLLMSRQAYLKSAIYSESEIAEVLEEDDD